MANKIINIEDVSLKTMSIEIKALTMSNKKMTMGVFRQLPERDILDYDAMKLKGKPWGKVEYYWGEQNKQHIHIIWQSGTVLYRDLFNTNLRVHDMYDYLSYGAFHEATKSIKTFKLQVENIQNKINQAKSHHPYDEFAKEYHKERIIKLDGELKEAEQNLKELEEEHIPFLNTATKMHTKYLAIIPQIQNLQQIFIAV